MDTVSIEQIRDRARSEIAEAQGWAEIASFDDSDQMRAHFSGVIAAAQWVLGERSGSPVGAREVLAPGWADIEAEAGIAQDRLALLGRMKEVREPGMPVDPALDGEESFVDAVIRELHYLRFGGESPAEEI